MRVLSLFDGISVAHQALKENGVSVDAYYASEVDKYAVQITMKNHPGTVQLGDVNRINIPTGIDLMIGGSPCQDLSIAKKNRKGLDGEKSGLFWEYVRILRVCRPRYFVLENVASMAKEAKAIITAEMCVEPIMIDAALVSAQSRKRLFWTNIPGVTQPKDRGILLKDMIDTNENSCMQYRRTYWRSNESGKIPTLTSNMGTGGNNVPYVLVNSASLRGRHIVDGKRVDKLGAPTEQRVELGGDKANTISTVAKDSMVYINTGDVEGFRKLTPVECERLQSLPDNYTEGVSNCQRYKALGNAFNCAVIRHILSFMR